MTEKAKPVRTLDEIKARCIEVGECWEWQGAMSGCGQPRHRIDGKDSKVHHTAFKLARKRKPKGLYLVRSCGNSKCVNPDHIEPMTRSEQMKLAASLGRCSRPDQIIARTNGNRAKSAHYSPERAALIREMRGNGEKLTVIAEAVGISPDLVSKVARGVVWANHHQASSVFSWRPA